MTRLSEEAVAICIELSERLNHFGHLGLKTETHPTRAQARSDIGYLDI